MTVLATIHCVIMMVSWYTNGASNSDPSTPPPLIGDHSVPDTSPARPTLTAEQRARRDFAHLDLDEARTTDLAAIGEASLIMLVEKLRGRLDDALRLIDETHG